MSSEKVRRYLDKKISGSRQLSIAAVTGQKTNEKTAKQVGGFSRIVGLSTGNWIG
jgi:hypothetical protein